MQNKGLRINSKQINTDYGSGTPENPKGKFFEFTTVYCKKAFKS